MDGGELSKEVARLEARMEELAEVIERCRKVDLASKVAIALGGVLLSPSCSAWSNSIRSH